MKRLSQILVACTIAQALQDLRPGAQWKLNGDQYSGITWMDSTQTKPPASEVASSIAACSQAQGLRNAAKAKAKTDVKNTSLTMQDRFQALLILTDND